MSQKWWVLTAVACGTFMATLDSSIVNIALPTLTKSLQTSLHHVKWVVISYLLVITCFLLPFGRLSDQYGRKRTFQLGLFIFVLGSALCAVASTLLGLVLFRMIQGIGAAMLMANGPAVITAAFPTGERGKALGTLAMVVSLGLISGPSLGGVIISQLGWESIFFLNIPVGIIGILIAQVSMEKDPPIKKVLPFDWAGALIQIFLFISFIALLDPPRFATPDGDPIFIPRGLTALLTLIFGALFIQVESQAEGPLFDMSLLEIKTFRNAILAGFLIFVGYSSLAVIMPFFLEEVLHFAPDQAGLYMTAIPVMVFLIAPISGRLSDRFGSQELSSAGALIGAIALLAMGGAFGAGLHTHAHVFSIILGLAAVGFGLGLFQSPNNNTIMGVIPPTKLGVASALMATTRNLGLMTGTGISTALFSWHYHANSNFVSALHVTLLFAGLATLGATLSSSLARSAQSDRIDHHGLEKEKRS